MDPIIESITAIRFKGIFPVTGFVLDRKSSKIYYKFLQHLCQHFCSNTLPLVTCLTKTDSQLGPFSNFTTLTFYSLSFPHKSLKYWLLSKFSFYWFKIIREVYYTLEVIEWRLQSLELCMTICIIGRTLFCF